MKTLTVDDQKRVRIPHATPRQVFAYERDPAGRVTLTPVEPAKPPPAKLVRRNGVLLAKAGHTITHADVRRVMDTFP